MPLYRSSGAGDPVPRYTGIIAVASSTGNGYLGETFPGSKVYGDANASVTTGKLASGSNFNRSSGIKSGGNGSCSSYHVMTSHTSCSLSVTWVNKNRTSPTTIIYGSDGSLHRIPTYSILGKDVVNENGMLTEKGMSMVLEAPVLEDPFYEVTEA